MKRFLAVLLLLPALLLYLSTERFAWRQKMTVTVETPAGEVSGSSVSAVRWLKLPNIDLSGGSTGWSFDLTGEAVVVEVSPGRILFALLIGPGTPEYMGYVAPASLIGADGRVLSAELFDEVDDKRDRAAGVIMVPEQQYPLMVTFADLADPASVALVDPNDLDATFGCDRAAGAPEPVWRAAGVTWREWADAEAHRLSREGASARAGLPAEAAAALDELMRIVEAPRVGSAEEERALLDDLRQHFTWEEQRRWERDREELRAEIAASLPTPADVARDYGGPCHRLVSVTLEVTREPVTERRVEAVLGWLDDVWPNKLDGQRYETITAENRLANSLGTGWFSTEVGQ